MLLVTPHAVGGSDSLPLILTQATQASKSRLDAQLKFTLEHVVDNNRSQQVAKRDTALYGSQLDSYVQTVVVVITDKSIMSSIGTESECASEKGGRDVGDSSAVSLKLVLRRVLVDPPL
jgi:hypothetical protein